MNKLLYILLILGGFAVLLGVGRFWKLQPETKYNHVLHTGEKALLTSKVGSKVWVALDAKDCYPIGVAMSKVDTAYLSSTETNQTAFVAPVGASVMVLGQTESRVHVEVADGALAGKRGWVEFEYVRPRKAGELQ
ncbi:MAG TPA: hypothetical protein VGK29_12180 [Paludibaculum sp.]|jgi:hypothetical protein